MARILLAEDDASLRVFLSTALERAGHSVLPLDDGLEALAAARAVEFDLLVTDVVMPSLDGFQVAGRAREACPDIKVMFITGFAAVTLRGRDRELKGAKLLSKPFHLRELVERVDAFLKEPATAL